MCTSSPSSRPSPAIIAALLAERNDSSVASLYTRLVQDLTLKGAPVPPAPRPAISRSQAELLAAWRQQSRTNEQASTPNPTR